MSYRLTDEEDVGDEYSRQVAKIAVVADDDADVVADAVAVVADVAAVDDDVVVDGDVDGAATVDAVDDETWADERALPDPNTRAGQGPRYLCLCRCPNQGIFGWTTNREMATSHSS